jgi:hypothetical protein
MSLDNVVLLLNPGAPFQHQQTSTGLVSLLIFILLLLSWFFIQQRPFEASTGFDAAIPHLTNHTFHGDSSNMLGTFIQGGYTELLLQTDKTSELQPTSRRLDFDSMNPAGCKE